MLRSNSFVELVDVVLYRFSRLCFFIFLRVDSLTCLRSFPCKFFHTIKSCREGSRCRFSHDALTEETSRILQEVSGHLPAMFLPFHNNPFRSASEVLLKKVSLRCFECSKCCNKRGGWVVSRRHV